MNANLLGRALSAAGQFQKNMIGMMSGLVLMGLLAGCVGAPANQPPGGVAATPTPAVYLNGTILTQNPKQPMAESLLVQDGKITAVGSEAEIKLLMPPDAQVVDLGGLTLMPGFVDAHTHVLNDARSMGMSLDEAQMLALRNGITTLGDLYVDRPFLNNIQSFANSGQLRVRTSLYLVYDDPCGNIIGDWWKDYPPTRTPGEMLRIGGVKIFTDGGSCGNVALSFDHNHQNLGDLWLTQDELNTVVAEAQSMGYQVAIHAIGDRAVDQAQTAIAAALNGGPNLYRHRMEHLSVLTPQMVERFGTLGIIPVIPGQYPSCTPFGPPLPEAYGDWEWPWADLRSVNPTLPIAWHSDYPFWSINPFVHLYGFVTRNDVYSITTCKPQTWLRDDLLTVEQALSIMTVGSAYALFRETEVGSLEPGKYADLIIVSNNPLTAEPDELKSISVLATIVGGQVEYCHPRNLALCPGYTPRTPAPLPDLRPPVPVRWLLIGLTLLLPLAFGALYFVRRPLAARLGGWAGLLAGIFWMLTTWLLMDDFTSNAWVFMVAPTSILLAMGAVGLGALRGSWWLGRVGWVLATLAAIVFGVSSLLGVYFDLDGSWQITIVSLLAYTLGLMLFGIAALRKPVLWRFNGLPLVVGLLGGPVAMAVSFVLQQDMAWSYVLYMTGLGVGWIVLGALVVKTSWEG